MQDILIDTLIDSAKLFPFLFFTYLIMEYIEHRTKEKAKETIKRSGKFGPLWGGLLGVFPQCGFSAAASGLFAGKVITLGTLIAIFLSTSDEMLPILISEQAPISMILKILGLKMIIGIGAGFMIDMLAHKKAPNEHQHMDIEHICEHEHCRCEEGIVKSAWRHTINIALFILIISFVLNTIIYYVGEEFLANLILNRPILGQAIAGLVGMIPNCASSVILTQLYLEGVMGLGAMMAGLLAGTGVGILVLFKTNTDRKGSIKITLLLYVIGVFSGILIDLFGIVI